MIASRYTYDALTASRPNIIDHLLSDPLWSETTGEFDSSANFPRAGEAF